MADVAGTVAFVKELATSPPANQTSPTLASAGESLVVGLATLESVSFFLGKNVICFSYSVSIRFTRWCVGRNRCLSSRYIGCFPPPGQGERMIVVFYRSDGRGFVDWGCTRDKRHFPKCTVDSGCFSSVCYRLDGIVL